MQNAALTISFLSLVLISLLVVRGYSNGLFRAFSLFYSYIVFNLIATCCLYIVYQRDPHLYPSAYWIYYLFSILVEFTVLIEFSDQIFRPYPAIRSLGRALTIVISAAL